MWTKDSSSSALVRIALCCARVHEWSGAAGEEGREMFVVVSGQLEVLDKHGERIGNVSAGQQFGEIVREQRALGA